MRVACWVDGEPTTIDNHNLTPQTAAEQYAAETAEPGPIRVVVEAIDDEAMALPGWHSNPDEYGPRYKLFDVFRGVVTPWLAEEVDYESEGLT